MAIGLLLSLITPAIAISPADLVQQGHSYYQQGQFLPALHSWQQAETAYRQTKNLVGIVGSQSNQSQALNRCCQ